MDSSNQKLSNAYSAESYPLIWAQHFGVNGVTSSRGISVDGLGNSYDVGYIELIPGYYDVYIAKYNSRGRLLWVDNLGYSGNNKGYGMIMCQLTEAEKLC